jgi:type III restriction enzyme
VNFQSQPVELEKQTVFSSTLGRDEFIQRTQVHQTAHSVDEVVSRLHGRLKSVDLEGDTRYAKDYPRSVLRKVIETSLGRIGESRDLVSEENLQHAYRAMGNVRRDVAKAARIERHPEALEKVSTRTMQARSAALSSFYKETTVFCDSESEQSSEEFDQQALAELTSPDAAFPRRAVYEVDNLFRFKSPVNVVLTTHEPERRFVARLFEPTIAEKVSAWVKAPDVGFYSIAFSWRKGNHTKQANFNPDLFIRLSDNRMLVVELKSDAAVTDENRAKRDAAREHFKRLNEMQADTRYSVHLLSPDSYDGFFDAVKSDKADEYVSSLEAGLGS